ncbi:MAG: hypothetical protein HFF90_12470 [Oscillibacter sp.]|nr:hypothetical protein [Oscillibacter sp.]
MAEKGKMGRTEAVLGILTLCLGPLHLYLSWSNFFNSIDKGYGHSYPALSYVLIGVYLLIVLGTDCFMLLKGRFEMARALRRYWGSSVIAVGLLLVIHVSFPDSLAVIFPMVYSPYVVLVPVIEWLGMPENAWWVSGFVAAFCLVNWAVCRFCVRDCGC